MMMSIISPDGTMTRAEEMAARALARQIADESRATMYVSKSDAGNIVITSSEQTALADASRLLFICPPS